MASHAKPNSVTDPYTDDVIDSAPLGEIGKKRQEGFHAMAKKMVAHHMSMPMPQPFLPIPVEEGDCFPCGLADASRALSGVISDNAQPCSLVRVEHVIERGQRVGNQDGVSPDQTVEKPDRQVFMQWNDNRGFEEQPSGRFSASVMAS